MLQPYHPCGTVRCIAPLLGLLLALAARPARAHDRLPAEVLLPWTPVRALLPDYCGPAALTNVVRYWGRPADQAAIGQAVFDRRRGGTLAGDLILWAREAGFQAYSRAASRDQLKRWLAAGLPVIVLQDRSPRDRRGHFRIVVGYSDPKRQFIVCDCTESSLCGIDYKRFDDLWFHFDSWCLLVAPADKLGSHPVACSDTPILHLDLAEAYVRRGDPDAARRHARAALQLSPGDHAAAKLLAKLTPAGISTSTRRAGAAVAAGPRAPDSNAGASRQAAATGALGESTGEYGRLVPPSGQ